MKSIAQQVSEAQSVLLERGVTPEQLSAITNGGSLEQSLSKLQEHIAQKPGRIIIRKNGIGACKESFEPSTVRLLEVLKRNGYSDQESWVMAGLKGGPITEADIKEIPTGQETLYETLRQSYGHKEALLMMVD